MKYAIRSGIIRREAAGETMLIAVGSAIGHCPDMEVLNDGAAYYWTLLEQGMDEEQMLQQASADTGETVADLRPGLSAFMNALKAKGYILAAE